MSLDSAMTIQFMALGLLSLCTERGAAGARSLRAHNSMHVCLGIAAPVPFVPFQISLVFILFVSHTSVHASSSLACELLRKETQAAIHVAHNLNAICKRNPGSPRARLRSYGTMVRDNVRKNYEA